MLPVEAASIANPLPRGWLLVALQKDILSTCRSTDKGVLEACSGMRELRLCIASLNIHLTHTAMLPASIGNLAALLTFRCREKDL